jgi:hypothetical protein
MLVCIAYAFRSARILTGDSIMPKKIQPLLVSVGFACLTLLAGCAGAEKISLADAIKTASAEARIPEISAETLIERKVILPRDLPGERTLVLIAFVRSQQKNIDTWVAGLDLMESSIEWIEAPVIDKPNALSQSFINGGMRMGIPDPNVRDRTITLYTSRNELIAAMHFKSGQNTIYAAVVDRQGKLWAAAEGDYSVERAAPLLAALAPARKP